VRFKGDPALKPAVAIVKMDVKERRKHGIMQNGETKWYVLLLRIGLICMLTTNRRKGSVTLSECLGSNSRKTAETTKSTKAWSIWVIKILFACYLAACFWNILAAVRDGVIEALEPIFALWNFAKWVAGK
jgi:hypothetical protein